MQQPIITNLAFPMPLSNAISGVLQMADDIDAMLEYIDAFPPEEQAAIIAAAKRLNALMARMERDCAAREN